MIIIADSGSTKTNWWLIDTKITIKEITTEGINPFYQTQENIIEKIKGPLTENFSSYSISEIFFYGAGCANDEKKSIVHNAIKEVIDTKITVESDLLGAARGLLINNKGIACILGTGSNSCYYDGNSIIDNVSPLGYIIGDEGSGAVLGKKFVGLCLKNQLGEEIKTEFLKHYNLTPADIVENIYRKPFPNRFLAQFTKFIKENIDSPKIQGIVEESFCEFLERNVMQYNLTGLKVSFIGSIAYHFEEILRSAAESRKIEIDTIALSPLPGLVEYHSSK